MKILLIRTAPTLLDVERNTYNVQELGLAKALSRRGHQADLLFWTDQAEKTVTVPVPGGATIHVFYRRGPAVLKNAWYPHFDALAREYDILQAAEYNQLFSWHLAANYPEKTVIYHGPYYAPFNKNYNRMCRVFDALCVGRYRELGTPFLVKSPYAEEFLRSKGLSARQVTTVGVGLDPACLCAAAAPTALEQAMRRQNSDLKLLYIGRVEPRRDTLFLLDVLRALRSMGQWAVLYLLGDGPAAYTARVQAAIRAQGLGPAVVWQRKAAQPQLAGLYRAADFFLLPTEYEIFGMVLLEAMYFGRVVLTTDGGGARQLIRSGENGLVLPKDDPARWARALCALARDPERRTRMEAAAHRTVAEGYTWDALADRFLRVYAQLAGGNHE